MRNYFFLTLCARSHDILLPGVRAAQAVEHFQVVFVVRDVVTSVRTVRRGISSLVAAAIFIVCHAWIAPVLDGRECIAKQGPHGRKIGDINGDRRFSEIPVQVGVGYEGRNERVDFCQQGCGDDEGAHAEDGDQDDLLLDGDAELEKKRYGDKEDRTVGTNVEGTFDDLEIEI